jgi:hypothetical protein
LANYLPFFDRQIADSILDPYVVKLKKIIRKFEHNGRTHKNMEILQVIFCNIGVKESQTVRKRKLPAEQGLDPGEAEFENIF